MERKKSSRFSTCLLLFAAGLAAVLNPSLVKGQNNSSGPCEWKWKWVSGWEWEWEYEYVFNPRSGLNELENVYKNRFKNRYRYVYDCLPLGDESASNTSTRRNTSHPNTIRNADGTLRPANGYHWVNPKDPEDFRVQLNPGLIESASGKLRPAGGYRWVNQDNPDDFRVEPNPGLVENTAGSLRPAKGFRWVNPNDPTDFRVQRIP